MFPGQVKVLEQGAQTDEREYREQVVEDHHRGLYPVTAQTGQFLLHGIVHEMDESGQRVFGTAARAAENY
jgi:hypothetical protein